MDENFANMRSLIQVLDQTLFDSIQNNGDFSHFYFCYRHGMVTLHIWNLNTTFSLVCTFRWFLLDFKREFTYHEIFLVWETIWYIKKVFFLTFHLLINIFASLQVFPSSDLFTLLPFRCPGPCGELPRHHPRPKHGLHRHHQVLQ